MNRFIDRKGLFFKCYGEAMVSWNSLEINITNLILVICDAKDKRALSAAINRVVSIQTKIDMLLAAVTNCQHEKKSTIMDSWNSIHNLLSNCQKQRNKLAHFTLLHRTKDYELELVLVDNLLKFPRKNDHMDIIQIENARMTFFALSSRLENLNHLISGNPNTLPKEYEEIRTVNSIDEILKNHGYVDFIR